jgi:hypothetical protein
LEYRRQVGTASALDRSAGAADGRIGDLYVAGRPAGGSDGISIAPALDTTAAVIILALSLPSESLPGPKSLKRMAV